MKLVSVSEMRSVEKEANSSGLTYATMMENAGHNLAREVMELAYFQNTEGEEVQVLGLVGPGNNGGDTLVALAHLADKGWIARAYLVNRKPGKDDLIKRLEASEGEILLAEADEQFNQLQAFIETADVILDGVLGTGFNLPLQNDLGKVLSAVKSIIAQMEWPPFVIAVDCPSGIDADTGKAAEEVIPADATITMAAIKRGLLALPAYTLAGELRVVNIGQLDGLKTWQAIPNLVADDDLVAAILPERLPEAHKGTFGTLLIAAGSLNYTGAALLAGKAAYRIGTGLVTLAIPAPLHAALAGHFPEATWLLLPHEMGVISSNAADVIVKNLDRATALLIGPGLGLEDTTYEFIVKLLSRKVVEQNPNRRIGFLQEERKQGTEGDEKGLPPLVVDADGLKLLAKIPGWPKRLPPLSILTPHPGEMSVLTKLSVEEIQQDRMAKARHFSSEWGHIVVLKGAFTIIASPDGRTSTIPVADSALARAGTGDVLAGLIAGLRAEGVEPYEAAVAGAYIHAKAGLVAADDLGSPASVMAGDILDSVPVVLSEF